MFEIKSFHRKSSKLGIEEEDLIESAKEIQKGLFEASLGGKLFKKRIARKNEGKSGGFRTILAYQDDERLFYLYVFEKSKQANVNKREQEALKKLGALLLSYTDKELTEAETIGELHELVWKEEDEEQKEGQSE